MELKDTVKLMNSSDYKERFIAEYAQTKIRYVKLKKFIIKVKYAKLFNAEEPKHDCPLELLELQALSMCSYLSILEKRARDYEHIELPEIEDDTEN